MKITIDMLTVSILILCFSSSCFGFDNKVTHPDIMNKTINSSSFHQEMTRVLGTPDGRYLRVKGIEAWKILEIGSIEEDTPVCRAANHFHNPLLPWDQSQATDVWPQDLACSLAGWTPRYSAITWATGLTAADGSIAPRIRQEMGWDNARSYFYAALTSGEAASREASLAKSLQAVGQTMHLLQDMAVPAHVRNDFLSHLIFSSISSTNPLDWFLNPFETYVANHPALVSSISQVPQYATAGARVTDFWDVDTGVVSVLPKGLANYTHTGYLSDFTIPGNLLYREEHTFPMPQMPIYTCSDKIAGSKKKRKYASRQPCPTDGSPVDHFAAISMFSPRLLGMPPLPLPYVNKYVLDDNVHLTYAKTLLPQAVGYSTALLDYFFRGSLHITPVEGGVTFRNVTINAENATPGETMRVGEARLVIRYRALVETALADGRYQLENPSEGTALDDYVYRVSKPLIVDMSSPQQLTFDFSDDLLPYAFGEIEMQLVFKGKLGNEDGAVAVSPVVEIAGVYSDFDVSLPPSGVYAKTDDLSTSASFNELRVSVHTDIPGGLTGGQFKLALEYRQATSDPFLSAPVVTAPENAASYLLHVDEASGVNSLQQGQTAELVFNLAGLSLPVWATDVYLNVLYVDPATSKNMAIGFRDISEPTPVDVFNNADKICIGNTWYEAGSTEVVSMADADQDGFPELFDPYPHNIEDILYKASFAGASVTATAEDFTLQSPSVLPAGNLRRLGYLLTDYDFSYSLMETWTAADPANDPYVLLDYPSRHPGTAVVNQEGVYPSMYNMRGGNLMWWGAGVVWDNEQYESTTCTWNGL